MDKSKTSFCGPHQEKVGLLNILRTPANLLPMKNTGGMFGLKTGVCWWHSRLQRRFTYLAHFRPDLPKSSLSGVKKILRKIKRGKEVVIIPGYKNLEEFGKANGKWIQKSLNAWMAGDSLIRQTWIKGLVKKKIKTEEQLQAYLEEIYKEFKSNKGLLVQILNFKGVSAHAWIILNMTKNSDGKFELEVLDSNKPQAPVKFTPDSITMNPDLTQDILYTSVGNEGVDASKHPLTKYSDFLTITYFRKEEQKLKNAVATYCR